jgi:hypothetical protein
MSGYFQFVISIYEILELTLLMPNKCGIDVGVSEWVNE